MRDLFPSAPGTAAALGLDLNGIMWTDATVNPGLFGCAYASPACGTADRSSQCYAEATAASIVRKGRSEKAAPGLRAVADLYAEGLTPEGRWTGRISVHPERIVHAFAKLPKKAGRIRRAFVTSMSDLFHKDVPFDFLDLVFAEMEERPWIAFQATTKRAERAAEYAADRRRRGLSWPRNVWLIVTVENQEQADKRIPHALRCRAEVVGLSVEPMLGAIRLDKLWCHNCETDEHVRVEDIPGTNHTTQPWCVECDSEVGPAGWLDSCASATQPGVSWVIIGSESDGPRPGARKTNDADVLDLVDQCDAAGVPVFVKQLEIDGRLCALPMVRGQVRAGFPGAA